MTRSIQLRRLSTIVAALLHFIAPLAGAADDPASVSIIVANDATSPERVAAADLAEALGTLYPNDSFHVSDQDDGEGRAILLGTPGSAPELAKHLVHNKLCGPQSYVVTSANVNGRTCGLIVGADPAGVAYGVYGLLRKLGCGFYLSFDTYPEPKRGQLSLADWELADQPLVPTRLVFNWHNFLSGCSTWDLQQWQDWITQSQKMGYNSVMVHAYGNNPMAGFEFRGVQKPVGYLSSTRVGRDWSTNHVNDVRRLWGGEIFDSAVFGSDAAVEGSDHHRTAAAQNLMSDVFQFAERKGVDVFLAVDIDTTSANPQELILALPEQARFQVDVSELGWMNQAGGKAWLANPDTPQGFEFYKTQLETLLKVYPDIDCFVAWHRRDNTPWMNFSRDSMPATWQEEYDAVIKETPEAAELWHSHHLFAQAKIVSALAKALEQLGRSDIRLAFGSWDFQFLPAADRFLSEDVALMPLDYSVLKDQSVFDTAQRRRSVAHVASHRTVVPIAWAHHDDGNYVGRPYTPYSDFHDRLVEMNCDTAGYGIIHWTTKPLDLYFASLVNQVWAGSKNQSLDQTCRQMAVHLVGEREADRFGAYLQAWVTTMPKIGRETLDFFIDHELKDLNHVQSLQQKRLEILGRINRSSLGSDARQWLDYFNGLERFILDIYHTEDAFHRAKKEYEAGDWKSARSTMQLCQPERIIEEFAKFSQLGGLTRGEEGLVVTMNTRWLPHYVRFRQQIGIESVRYNFCPTSHDPLAQSRGVFTFHFDDNHDMWQCLGEEETGAKAFLRSADVAAESANVDHDAVEEICRSGIESNQPISFAMNPILTRHKQGKLGYVPLGPGKYELTLLLRDAAARGPNTRVFDVRIQASGRDEPHRLQDDRVDPYQRANGPDRVLRLSYQIELSSPGSLQVTLTPVQGTAILCGAVLAPRQPQ